MKLLEENTGGNLRDSVRRSVLGRWHEPQSIGEKESVNWASSKFRTFALRKTLLGEREDRLQNNPISEKGLVHGMDKEPSQPISKKIWSQVDKGLGQIMEEDPSRADEHLRGSASWAGGEIWIQTTLQERLIKRAGCRWGWRGSWQDSRSENVLMVSQETRRSPTVGPAVPLLGVHPGETRTSAHTNTCPGGF